MNGRGIAGEDAIHRVHVERKERDALIELEAKVKEKRLMD